MAKKDFNRVVLALKNDDPLLRWLESKRLIGERATSTATVRILRQVMTLEAKGEIGKAL